MFVQISKGGIPKGRLILKGRFLSPCCQATNGKLALEPFMLKISHMALNTSNIKIK
jgi:hypothetical protein